MHQITNACALSTGDFNVSKSQYVKSMSKKTISEELFERFCITNNIEYQKIPEESQKGDRTPDYQISSNKVDIIVEVKQFDPTKEEQKLIKQLEERRWTDAQDISPGKRARAKIDSAMGQLKKGSQGRKPTMLVLYNNVFITKQHSEPYAIKTALYGFEAVDISVPNDNSLSPYISNKRFGSKRRVTENQNTSLSAVAVLINRGDKLYLQIFHNKFAKNPLDPKLMNCPTIKHYYLEEKTEGEFQGWVEYQI